MYKVNRLFCAKLRARSRKRAEIRGHNIFKVRRQLGVIRSVHNSIAATEIIDLSNSHTTKYFGFDSAELQKAIHQFLIQNYINSSLAKAIFIATGLHKPVSFGLPSEWRTVLREHGIEVDDSNSALLWRLRLLVQIWKSVLSILTMIGQIVVKQRVSLPVAPYAYLMGLTRDNLPNPDSTGRSHDICNWYARWKARSQRIGSIRHDVPSEVSGAAGIRVEYLDPPFLLLRGLKNIIKQCCWCCAAGGIAIYQMSRGHWWYALILDELVKANVVSRCASRVLASDYLFHYSGKFIYRPLWTYTAQALGCRVMSYFYSSYEAHKLSSGYEVQKFDLGISTWPIHLVWDKYQEDLIRREIGPLPNVYGVGPIWFSTNKSDLQIGPNTVAVFDNELVRPSYRVGFSTAAEYNTSCRYLNEQFLDDLLTVFTEHNLRMALKRKRHVGTLATKRYRNFLNSTESHNHVVMIDPDKSAVDVIENCVGVISLPFTSAALHAIDYGKPSAYYDPIGWVQHDDRAAHGIEILRGIAELRRWIKMNIAYIR
jgi:polysaccharide biosynthesis PFTS motif protein